MVPNLVDLGSEMGSHFGWPLGNSSPLVVSIHMPVTLGSWSDQGLTPFGSSGHAKRSSAQGANGMAAMEAIRDDA